MTDPLDNTRRNIAKHGIPTGTDDPVLLSLGAKPLSPHDARTEHQSPEPPDAVLAALGNWHRWATRYTREHAHKFIASVQAGDFTETDRILATVDPHGAEIARLRTSLAQANRTITDLQEHRK